MVPFTTSGDTRGNARGNTLLLVIIFTALMALMMTLVIRPIRVRQVRQKESLLIYRGEHLARGIREFYFRFGRFPFELEELMDVEPRVVRKLYKDPMTESGEWELVFLGQQNRTSLESLIKQFTPQDQNGRRKPGGYDYLHSMGGQIIGIKSKSTETGYREYQFSRIYSDWFFSALRGKSDVSLQKLQNQLNDD